MWSLGSFSQKAAASRRVSRPSFWRPLVFPALAVRPASVLNSLPEHVQSHQHQPPQAPTALSTEQHQDELSEFMPSGDLEPFVAKHAPKTKALSMYDWRLRAVSQREAHPGQLEGLRQVRIHGKDHFRLKWGTQPELEAFRTSYMELVALERDELEKEAEERLAKTKPDPAEGLTLWDLRVEVQHTKTSKDEILVCLNCDEAVLSRHQFR